MQIELLATEFENLERSIAQIADLAGSQGLGEIEQLTESVLAILEGAKIRADKTAKQFDRTDIPEQTEMG